MKQKVEVSCIVKREHHNPHERILFLGGVHNGKRWKMSEDETIRRMKLGEYDFYVSQGGRTTDVMIAKHEGREYLKTVADGYIPDNLLSLTSCPLN